MNEEIDEELLMTLTINRRAGERYADIDCRGRLVGDIARDVEWLLKTLQDIQFTINSYKRELGRQISP